jgi:hypothetical protein
MNINKIVDELIALSDRAIQGDIKASKAFSLIYQLEKACKDVKSEITESVLNELDSYSKNDLPVYDGFRIVPMSRSSWSYNDSVLDTLTTQVKSRQKAMQQAFAHAQKHGEPLITPDGEIIPPAEQKHTTYIKMETVK